MKINQDLRLNIDNSRKETKLQSRNGIKFNEFVQKYDQKMQMEKLQQLIKDIDDAGERLLRSQTFKDLAKFKTLVKRFVKETVEFGMQLKQSHSWNQFGQGRSLKIVETIDQKLVELTEDILEKEEKSMNLLEKIGEIKGLLINLYT
ncbi:YaaR family protein [Bacillus methanolicus]|uniref:DUF327 domain-containing protein n=1 Tax=Bacillus methanolicus (strain MGA3 / ATCC 53907) TaxID=796606 RepID=I3EC14_BACMM|nr:YaaR family protein [Bacillus methanolicus]AIE58557.1 hypothetical protein BMMGA3_00190 [Bacillus methanolicus MGA3]EIJ84035.1 hypothetical protein MGA3_02045 [Bacillus methanolicus MGA3]UQD50652.1 DUF327 family protein [Bacillus methanolicus]